MEKVVSEQDLGASAAPEKIISFQGQKGVSGLASDKEYLEAYFDICRLYQLKRAILCKSKDDGSKLKALKDNSPESDVTSVNAQIQRQEDAFWQKVEEEQKRGLKFAIEEVAAKYKLDLFEKRLLLFFLYLEYFAIETNLCTEDELLCIFDTENSVLSRMRSMSYFRSDSTLIKKALLCRDFKNESGSARVEIGLTSKALDIVSMVLNGKECPPSEDSKVSSSETIGYIKDPEYKFEDVLLSDDIKNKVTLFLDSYKGNKFEALGVTQRIKRGIGTAFLFFGPPGTGKSMLAEAIAAYVGKKLLIVEYPKIMDRWVGATDKNITQIFKCAEEEGLVVLLDEADTLFYSRAFAFEEHDIRFVNEMLQELEKFKGIIILTTNMDVLLDPALERRLSLKVKFELPSKDLRQKIWQSHIPDKVRLSDAVDFKMLAAKYDFSGGNIKNAVLNAFRKMASRNSDMLILEDLIFGANLEKEGMFNPQARRNVIGFSG